MKSKLHNLIVAGGLLLLAACNTKNDNEQHNNATTLKDAFNGKFLVGTALSYQQVSGSNPKAVEVVKKHFNAVVPENCMKSEIIQPKEGTFDFAQADQFVQFGEDNQLFITGHTLVWHSQTPPWLFVDEKGNDVSREVLIQRIKTHIQTLVGRYKGRVKGWDVVNEAIEDDGSLRNSKFKEIIGEDFIELAFQFANEADPDAELYYNDYSMANEGKRNRVVQLVKDLKEKGIRIDGVGMQGHIGMTYPSITEFEKSIVAYADAGVKVMITELDLTVLPMPDNNVGADVSASFEYQQKMNPYPDGLPADVETAWTTRYYDFFQLFKKHQDKITRVTLWGVGDVDSWRNDWPITGRTDYPLLFDRKYQPKKIVELITQ